MEGLSAQSLLVAGEAYTAAGRRVDVTTQLDVCHISAPAALKSFRFLTPTRHIFVCDRAYLLGCAVAIITANF
jgi:hypothetical protein